MPDRVIPRREQATMARFGERGLVFPKRRERSAMGWREAPAVLEVDDEGLHADGRVIRWLDFAGLRVEPDALIIETGNGLPLCCPAASFSCDVEQAAALIELWMRSLGEVRSPRLADPSEDDDTYQETTEHDWEAARLEQSPDDDWVAFGRRDDEDPLHR